MSSNFSNLVKPNTSQGLLSSPSSGFDFINPKNSALFSVARGIKNAFSPQTASAQTNVNVGASDPARNPQIKSTPIIPANNGATTNPTTTSNVSPNGQPDYKALLEQNLKGQLGNLQSQLAEKQAQQQNSNSNNTQSTTAGVSNDAFSNTLQGQLLKAAAQKGQQANDFNQMIGQQEYDAMHNRESSLSFGTGQAGQIAQNQGLKGQNLLTQAGQLSTLAGQATPNAQGYPFTFNPQTGKYEDSSNGQYGHGVEAQANIQIVKNFAGDYQTGIAKLKTADSIGKQIVNTLQANPTINTQPLSSITNLNEILSGQISSGPQQLLSQQVSQYIAALGLNPATVFQIAHQQQSTLAQLLDSLRQTAQAEVNSKNPSNLNFEANSNTSNNTSPGNTWNDIFGQ